MRLHLSDMLHTFGDAMTHFLRDPLSREAHADLPASLPVRKAAAMKLQDTEIWHAVTVGDLAEAERIFDRLDQTGFVEREFQMLRDDSYIVRWR